jgi:hypothetical protein
VLLCERCADRQWAEGAIRYWLPAPEEPPMPPEERFSEPIRAARALLQEGIEDENVIYSTFALANAVRYDLDLAKLIAQIVYQWDNQMTREALARDLARRCNGGLQLVGRSEEGSLIVESVPAAASLEYYQGTQIPEQVDLRMFPHRAPMEACASAMWPFILGPDATSLLSLVSRTDTRKHTLSSSFRQGSPSLVEPNI